MDKRLIIKTTIICSGIYIILSVLAIFVFNSKYDLDTEKRINVIVAANDVIQGEILEGDMLEYRSIRESDYSQNMVTKLEQCLDAKTLVTVKSGDYIFSYNILVHDEWKEEGIREIVIPMSIDDRLANLVRRGSIINIKLLPAEKKVLPKLVLSKVLVMDVLDENGLSLGETIGSKKGYAVFSLDANERDRIYAAMQEGKLIYELYHDITRTQDIEDYIIVRN